MYITLGHGQKTHLQGQNFDDLFCLIILYDILFYFIHVHIAQGKRRPPLGTIFFWWKHKGLVTLITGCMFQTNISAVCFYAHFLMVLYIYIALGHGQTTHLHGQNFDVNSKASSLWSFVASLKKSLKPLTLYKSFHV